SLLRLLDLAAYGRDQDVSREAYARVLERPHGLDVAGERALHVRDPEPVQPSVLDEGAGLEAGDVAQPRLAAAVRRVHRPGQHQRLAPARPRARAHHVAAAGVDLAPRTGDDPLGQTLRRQ